MTSRQNDTPGDVRPVGKTILLGADGKYRWTYEMSLFKNPTIFILVWKIFFFVILGIFAFIVILDAVDWGGFDTKRFLDSLKIMGWFLLGMTALVGVSYLIYAAVMGGKYIVEFEMDERGVNHRQIPAQAKKARRIGQAAIAAGIGTGRFSTAAASMSAQRTEMYSEFARVRKVRAFPRRNLIKVNERLGHNQIYVDGEDFAFVESFIRSHCDL